MIPYIVGMESFKVWNLNSVILEGHYFGNREPLHVRIIVLFLLGHVVAPPGLLGSILRF